MIAGQSIFCQLDKNDEGTYKSIRKNATNQVDDYTAGTVCLYLKKIISISKQQVSDPVTKALQQINFTGNLKHGGNTTVFFIFKDVKESYSQRKLFSIFHMEVYDLV